jgi:protein-serine/threonine kinase
MLKWEAISKTFPDFGPRKNKDKPQAKLALVAGRVSQVAKTTNDSKTEDKGEAMPTMGLLSPPRAKRYRLSEFAVRELIGRGAFSEVSLARHIFEEQHYALKVYKKSEIASSVKILRLMSEIEILRVVRHPFILPLRATFQDPRRIYLMFEFCQGGELFYHLRNYGTFKEEFVR